MCCFENAYCCPSDSLKETQAITEHCDCDVRTTCTTYEKLTSVKRFSRQTLKLAETVEQETVLFARITRNIVQFAKVPGLDACKEKVPRNRRLGRTETHAIATQIGAYQM